MNSRISIRLYLPSDLESTIEIFLRAICEVSSRDYSPGQIEAWAKVEDRDKWGARRLSRPTWIAEIDGKAAGFADLTADGCLDMMFVHPEFQRRGVASRLLARAQDEAGKLGIDEIHTEASLTARPFFEARGFQVAARQAVEKRGQVLGNFLMKKHLGGQSGD